MRPRGPFWCREATALADEFANLALKWRYVEAPCSDLCGLRLSVKVMETVVPAGEDAGERVCSRARGDGPEAPS
jgi:hypothetical protein